MKVGNKKYYLLFALSYSIEMCTVANSKKFLTTVPLLQLFFCDLV